MEQKKAEIDYAKILQQDINKGFTKKDLERLIGLPKNMLSAYMNSKRDFPRIAKLKIKEWSERTDKPNPLEIVRTRKKAKPKSILPVTVVENTPETVSEIEAAIKKLQASVCPSFLSASKFNAKKERDISNLQLKLYKLKQ